MENRVKCCGCSYRGVIGGRTNHSMSRTRIYRLWSDMQSRCYNPKTKSFQNYGGRGICVCEGFRDFTVFHAKLGEPPTDKHGPDRIDNNGNYSCGECSECLRSGWPFNVRWATKLVQMNNKRNNTHYEYNGESHTIAEWGRITGIPQLLIRQRVVVNKWPIGEALGLEPHAPRSAWDKRPRKQR